MIKICFNEVKYEIYCNIFGYEDIIKNVPKNRIGKYDKYTYENDKNEKLLILKCNWI